jgi:hypothetical protein
VGTIFSICLFQDGVGGGGVGGGRRVQFWYDNFCVYAALEDRFPGLFLVVVDESG